jgi:rod shape-determining protein MreC
MRALFRLIVKYHFALTFLILQFVCFYLIVTYNKHHKAVFFSSSNYFVGELNEFVTGITDYFYLDDSNEQLVKENTHLRHLLKSSYKHNKISYIELHDTAYIQQYTYQPAKVIRNSVDKEHNFITIDRGSRHGIEPEMGVISPSGVVGIINKVSYNYSTAISVLNKNLKISAKVKKNNYFGTLNWKGADISTAMLEDIPHHVSLEEGDSIVTSGYSAIFPEGIYLGEISEFQLVEGNNFYDIEVDLSMDFNNLFYVYIVTNYMKEEQLELEKQNYYD